MKSLHWQRIESLYEAALELDAAARSEFLQRECGGAEELQREVASLLAAHDEAGRFLEEPAITLTHALRLGSQIGQYKLLSLLGVGGMGEVYLAEDTRLHRQVALKLLPAEFSRDAGRVRRFEQEARATTALNHPHIVTLYDTGQHTDSYFIVNEFVDGQTLREHLNARVALPIGEALSIAEQIAKALAAAHAAGIAHRDIKPENVMLRRDGFVKVLDFGLAKQLAIHNAEDEIRSAESELIPQSAIRNPQSQTGAGVLLGTIRYMSPEQARGGRVDARTDVFSLGVVLYEMLAGRAPFERATAVETLAAILEAEPAALPDTVPAGLRGLLTKALRKEREERLPTAEELAMALREIAEDLQFSARLAEKSGWQFWLRRWPVWAGSSVVVLAMALAGYFGRQSRGSFESEVLPHLRTEPITDWKMEAQGNSLQLRVSPDEKLIAFSKGQDGQTDIFVKPLGEGEPVRLTNDAWVDHNPIWSPDGKQVIYLSVRDDQSEIWQSPSAGGLSRRLAILPNSFTKKSVRLLRWARAEQKIFFLTECNVHTLELTNGAIQQLTKFRQPNCISNTADISDDEQWVTYAGESAGIMQIFILPLAGVTPLQVTHEGEENLAPFWHPDGKRIIYQSKRNGVRQICAAYLDGRAPLQLTVSHEHLTPWFVSPLTQRIFYSTINSDADLFRFDLHSGAETRLSTGRKLEISPSVAPDGQAVAYQQASDVGHLDQSSIWLKPLAGDALSQHLVEGCDPRWSPSGQQIAFLRMNNDQTTLWTINTDGTNERPLVKSAVEWGGFYALPFQWKYTFNYSWAADGHRLAYISSQTGAFNVWSVANDGSDERCVSANTDPDFRLASPVFAPDQRRLACLAFRSTSGQTNFQLWLADAGQQKTVFQTTGNLRLIGWSPTGEDLFVSLIEDVNARRIADIKLLRIAVSSGAVSLLAKLPAVYLSSFRPAPNQQAVYVARRQDHDELWSISLSKGQTRKITASGDSLVYFAEAAWAPDAQAIFFSKQSNAIALWAIANFR